MIILGIDAAFRNMGLAVMEIDEEWKPHLMGVELVNTEADKSKQIRKNSDDLRRARELVARITLTIESADVGLVVAEVPSGTQSARASWCLGISVGVLAGITVPMIQVTPMEVKKITGQKHATKREMIDWALEQHPDRGADGWIYRGPRLTNANEHMADAVAAVHAAMITDDFLRLKIMMKQMAR